MSTISTEEAAALFQKPGGGEVADLGRQYVAIRRKIAEEEATLDALKKTLGAAEEAMLSKLEEQGVKSIRLSLEDGGEVLLTSTVKTDFRLPPEAKAPERNAVLVWLRESGAEALIKEDIHWARFQSWCCERRDDGSVIIPEVVQFERKSLSMRAAK